MSLIEFFLTDSNDFDEAEASNLALHVRLERGRHHRADKKLTFLIWIVSLFFLSFLVDAPHAAHAILALVLK
jgi:hypothetical protein